MVAALVGADIDSAQFGPVYDRLLEIIKVDRGPLVDRPDFTSKQGNRQRGWLLHRARGYGYGTRLFRGWPDDIEWFRAEVSPAELATFKSANHDLMAASKPILLGQSRNGPFVLMSGQPVSVGSGPVQCLVGISKSISGWAYWNG